MTPFLLSFLKDPVDGSKLTLKDESIDEHGIIQFGYLESLNGSRYPIIHGVPRFVKSPDILKSASAFGDQWNFFNFKQFRSNWLNHTVFNTWGSTDVFQDKLIVDAGGGSGAQASWFLEFGAKHVIILDLSHSLDQVVIDNLKHFNPLTYDLIQCDISNPPLLDNSISNGIVYCHNVIQHTPSVPITLQSLWNICGTDSELVFNCYPLNTKGILRFIRFYLIFMPLRQILKRSPFSIRLFYSYFVSIIRLVPLLGDLAEKLMLVSQGDVPYPQNLTKWYLKTFYRFRCSVVNTFDAFGSHKYQWYLSNHQINSIITQLVPPPENVRNKTKYFSRPTPPGTALRLSK